MSDRLDIIDQHRLDHFLYHLVRYKFAYRLITPVDSVLDYGCGTGYGTRLLANKALKVVGIDCDHEAIRKAQTLYHKNNLEYRVENWLANQNHEVYDVITCYEVLSFMRRSNAGQLIKAIYESLNGTGIALFSIPKHSVFEMRSQVRQADHQHEYSYDDFYDLLSLCFGRVVIFTQTDEIITLGHPGVCWTYIALCFK